MIQDVIKKAVQDALTTIGIPNSPVQLEHPADITHGDYSVNVAFAHAKTLKTSPRALADRIIAALQSKPIQGVSKIEVAGPGFINFHLTRDFYSQEIVRIIKEGTAFGNNKLLKGKKIVIDYTNPNPFKIFHIGHLMANTIGEALSRIIEAHGAHVVRVNYQGDVGLHVAKAVWGMLQNEAGFPKGNASLEEMIAYINAAYVAGAASYDTAKEEIDAINKMLFERSNPKLMKIYNWGRKVSLLNFEVIYRKLGTKFDHYFFESEVAKDGVAMVQDFLKRGIFAESEGAIVFKGEPYGLHTRVFITSAGLPTYETKEVGLTRIKFDKFNPDLSLVVTANEQNDYFRVVLKAISLMFPYMENKMKHISHGMLRLAAGAGGSTKMSSRTGQVITGESLLADVANLAREKMSGRDFGTGAKSAQLKEKAITDVSVGAIKYSILKQAPGGDIIYDFDKSISFEGDSGPYLQYSCVRAKALLAKAKLAKIPAYPPTGIFKKRKPTAIPTEPILLEKILYRYPETIERAGTTYEPHHIMTYLIELAGAFNNFYSNTTIIDAKDPLSAYRVALAESFAVVMKNGLEILGIRVPEKM